MNVIHDFHPVLHFHYCSFAQNSFRCFLLQTLLDPRSHCYSLSRNNSRFHRCLLRSSLLDPRCCSSSQSSHFHLQNCHPDLHCHCCLQSYHPGLHCHCCLQSCHPDLHSRCCLQNCHPGPRFHVHR